MRHILLVTLAVLSIYSVNIQAADGLVTVKSAHSASVTLDRLQSVLKSKGIRIFARVSHKDNAKGVDLDLRPTELLIFGNPKLGTHFFTSKQSAGIDLPMKALAWEDKNGQTWLAYNDPGYIAKRHGIRNRSEIVTKMRNALKKFTTKAASRP
ncbi:MAG: DUF302 domain-containing protein [Proteobacteria bacterium]|nr:DUF302 domain-containing protein [Pseudomonadota bacterium]